MKLKYLIIILFIILDAPYFLNTASGQMPCDVVQILHNPNSPVLWSPDSTKYLVNKQDTAGVYQIYVGNLGDTTLKCISDAYVTGNCCGLFRHWKTRNKMQVQWHPSGKYIVCGVEKEFYNELLYTPYSLLLGWLESGIWMDIWALTPDGSHWYALASTVHGMTGPAFTPDGSKCAWAEALDSANLSVDIFGRWRLQLSDFIDNAGTPSFANTTNINPTGSRWIEPGNFAPDGHRLLISSDIGISNAEGQDQFILDIISGQVTNLNNSPMIWDEHGVFSPDGNKILFMSSYPYRADTNSYHTTTIKTEFMLMDTNGTGLQQLTHFRDTGYFESSNGIAATGFWTHDGSMIYAQSLIFPDYDNWIIKFRGECGNITTTFVNEPERNDFQLFPNPVQNTLNVETLSDLVNAQVLIVNTFGQTVKRVSEMNGRAITIDVDDLKSGVYVLQIQTDKCSVSRAFIKSQ